MIRLLTILILSISLSTVSFANNEGDGDKLIETTRVSLSLVDLNQNDLILFKQTNTSKDEIEFIFTHQVKSIQLFDNNDQLVMTVPVLSNEAHLGLSLFQEGDYKMNINLR